MIKILPGLAVALLFPLYYLLLQVAIEFEIPSTNVTYTSRGLAVFLMGLLFFYSFRDGRLKAKWSFMHLCLLLFMVLYFARIVALNNEADWKLDSEHYSFFKVSMLFVFGSVAPFVIAMFSAKLFLQRATSNAFIFLTFFSVVTVAVLNLDQFGVFRTGGFNEGSLASLSMGYLAALGVGYCILDFLRLKRFPVIVLLLPMVASVYLLSVSASRGPILASIVSAIYIIFTMKKTVSTVLASVVFLIATIAGSLWFFNYSGSGLVYRIEGTSDEEARVDLYSETLSIINANLLSGKDIALSNGMWPHNLALEALLAVGVFGLLLIVPWIFALGKIVVVNKSDNSQWLFLWFLQTSVMNMFTGSIWAASSLFICLCIIIGGGDNMESIRSDRKRRRKRKRRRQVSFTEERV